MEICKERRKKWFETNKKKITSTDTPKKHPKKKRKFAERNSKRKKRDKYEKKEIIGKM